jgi:predicted ATPase
VKTEVERRERRQDLQVGMANALLQGRGIHAPETARSLAERINHPPTVLATFGITAFLDCVRRDPSRALVNAERTVALAGDFNLPTWRMIGKLSLFWARAALDPALANWKKLSAVVADSDAQGVGLLEIHRFYLASGYAKAGEFELSLAPADQALANIQERGLLVFLSEAHRVRGEILANCESADLASVVNAFHTAIVIARGQGARSLELRAALSLARIYESTGRRADAHAVLAPALEGFAPTPQMPEIAEAQALLSRLA